MLKKRLLSLLLVVCIIASVSTVAGARASRFLDGYAVSIVADGNGVMAADVLVEGVTNMTKIGVLVLEVQEKYTTNGSWHTHDVFYGMDDPDEFYDYNSDTYLNTLYLSGTPGYYYRVVVTVYAGDSRGSDTGEITSLVVRCK